MQRHLAIRASLLLAVCGASSVWAQGEPVLLRLAPPIGQVTPYLVAMDMTMAMPGGPMQGEPMTMRQRIHTTYSVVDAVGDTYTVSTVIDSMRMDVPGMGNVTDDELMGEIEGITGRVTMTTRGEIVSAEMDDQTMSPQMQQAMGGIGDFMGGLSLDLPVDPVRPGASWVVPVDNTMEMQDVGAMHQTMELTYTFDRVETRAGARHAILTYTGTLVQDLESDAAEMGMTMHYDGDVSGTMDLDLDAGRVHALAMEMALDGTTQVMGQKMNMAMTMFMEQTIVRR